MEIKECFVIYFESPQQYFEKYENGYPELAHYKINAKIFNSYAEAYNEAVSIVTNTRYATFSIEKYFKKIM